MTHKCSVLDPIKVSKTRTNLVCIECGEIVAQWDDVVVQSKKKEYPPVSGFKDAELMV